MGSALHLAQADPSMINHLSSMNTQSSIYEALKHYFVILLITISEVSTYLVIEWNKKVAIVWCTVSIVLQYSTFTIHLHLR